MDKLINQIATGALIGGIVGVVGSLFFESMESKRIRDLPIVQKSEKEIAEAHEKWMNEHWMDYIHEQEY